MIKIDPYEKKVILVTGTVLSLFIFKNSKKRKLVVHKITTVKHKGMKIKSAKIRKKEQK